MEPEQQPTNDYPPPICLKTEEKNERSLCQYARTPVVIAMPPKTRKIPLATASCRHGVTLDGCAVNPVTRPAQVLAHGGRRGDAGCQGVYRQLNHGRRVDWS